MPYNHINKNDTRLMKTIAVVTLFILPSTLVSSIFLTSIFNFQAKESATNPQVISSYGWVYLLTCLLLTGHTCSMDLLVYLGKSVAR
jgi:Mg2+ and Co2+ transporter CorA